MNTKTGRASLHCMLSGDKNSSNIEYLYVIYFEYIGRAGKTVE